MTKFQPPPDVPGTSPIGPPGTTGAPHGEPPWSVAAVSGFVLSLVGCLGVTAVLGLILGIIGIFRTTNRQRRGLGLAIAAIPLSLVTGTVAIIVCLMLFSMTQFMAQIPALVSQDAEDQDASLEILRSLGSRDFNENVSVDQIDQWFDAVGAKHGKIVEFGNVKKASSDSGKTVLAYEIKCVNGPATLKVVIVAEGLRFALDDIAIDEQSPRDMN